MIINEEKLEVKTSKQFESKQMQISPEFFNKMIWHVILQYKYKIRTSVQELISNAIDAQVDAVKDDRLDDIPALVDVTKSFDGIEGVALEDGIVRINGNKIPEVLNDRVLSFKEQGLPFGPLVKFSKKLLDNPSYNSREMLYKFLEHNGHPIAKDGNFMAYKKVRENFKDCHTGTIDNRVGNTVEMPRHLVDDNPNNTCSSGLHVASFEYAKGFSSGHIMLIEINPADVVSVPVDYNGEKMRVCRYVVKGIAESRIDRALFDEYDDDNYEDSMVAFDANGTQLKEGDYVTYEGDVYGITDVLSSTKLELDHDIIAYSQSVTLEEEY